MSLITCPECENQVSSKADSCPHCGAPVPTQRESFEKKHPFLKFFGLTFLGVVAVMIWAGNQPSLEEREAKREARIAQMKSESGPVNYRSRATMLCREAVGPQLKIPSSADFPLLGGQVTETGNKNFWVREEFTAKNLAGTQLDMKYTCNIKHIDNEWVIDDLDIW